MEVQKRKWKIEYEDMLKNSTACASSFDSMTSSHLLTHPVAQQTTGDLSAHNRLDLPCSRVQLVMEIAMEIGRKARGNQREYHILSFERSSGIVVCVRVFVISICVSVCLSVYRPHTSMTSFFSKAQHEWMVNPGDRLRVTVPAGTWPERIK